MSLDDAANGRHQDMIDNTDHPGWNKIPETAAAERIASVVGKYLDPRWLTDRCIQDIASKMVANRAVIGQVFAELDADPKAIGPRGTVLKQQATAEVDSIEWLESECFELARELDVKTRMLAEAKAGRQDQFDPDARDQDREDARLREQRQDEHAAAEAPRVAS